MPLYQTTFEIDATADRVWSVLTDLDGYADWNPQIPQISGALKKGSQIRLRLALPGKSPMDLSATIEDVKPGSLLTWRGYVVAPWFFEGHRRFEISPVTERHVRVTHVEDVRGLLAPLFSVFMGTAQQKSHDALNDALRNRAEAGE